MSSESSSSSSWSQPWKIALGVAGVAAAGAALYFLMPSDAEKKAKKKNKKDTKKKNVEEKKSKAPAASRKSATDEESSGQQEALSDTALQQDIAMSLQNIANSSKLSDEDKRLFETLRQLDPKQASPKTKIMAAQWIMVASTFRAAEEKLSAADVHADLALASRVLEGEYSAEEQQVVALLSLELFRLMKDINKLATILDDLLARIDSLPNEMLFAAFTVAPLTGRWKAFRELGRRIIALIGDLEQFHVVAMQHPEIQDLKVLYEMAEEADLDDRKASNQTISDFRIKGLSIRFRDVRGVDETKMETVRNTFDPEGKGDWKQIPVKDDHRLQIVGSIVQMLSFSAIAIPLVGPYLDNQMSLRGYAVINPEDGSGRINQTERYDLSLESPNKWQGTYVLVQDFHGDQSHVEMEFDVMIELELSNA